VPRARPALGRLRRVALLTAIATHLAPAEVVRQLAYLRALAPGGRFAICHGGRRADFDALDEEHKVFVDDPSLRGPNQQQSYTAVLRAAYESFVEPDPEVDLAYLIEFDQLVLRGDFEERLRALADATGAGLIAKAASRRDDTNWPHHLRHRGNAALDSFFERITTRPDPSARWGCLGSGMLFTRAALAAFHAATHEAPHAYLELFVPTTIHHLGFEIADPDRLGDLYRDVRWRPEFTLEEALAAKRAGRTFVHPFKRIDALDRVAAA
jgi:hypothetical protein